MSAVELEGKRVAIIIPSWTGNVDRLRTSLDQQTYRDYSLHVICGVSPAARARNLGVAQSGGETIVFLDDDAYLGHPRVLELLVAALADDPGGGVVGPSKLLPPTASWLQRRIAAEIPRWVYPVLGEDTVSDPPLDHYGFSGLSTTCCALSRALFEQVGGFNEQLPTGEDTEFFYRVRRAGYHFVVVGSCWVYHDPPRRLDALLRKSFHYGKSHAMEALQTPERHMAVVPLHRWYGKLGVLLSPLLFPPSLFVSRYFDPTPHWAIGFRPLKALSTYATLYGYTWGWFRRPQPPALLTPRRQTE